MLLELKGTVSFESSEDYYLEIYYLFMRDYAMKKKLWDSCIFFDQTFLGLELGTLPPARESLLSDIPAGDGNIAKLSLQCEKKMFGSTISNIDLICGAIVWRILEKYILEFL